MSISKAEVAHRLSRLGARVANHRLGRNLTQKQLALEAGVSLSTIRRLEDGANVSLEAMIGILDSLGLADRLETLVPSLDVRPVERAKMRGRERRRASPKAAPAPASDWAWGDEP